MTNPLSSSLSMASTTSNLASSVGSNGLSINQSQVTSAASLMNNLSSSGNVLSKSLPIVEPLAFGVIGSSTAAAHASMEDTVLQALQGVLNLFSDTSSDIQSVVASTADADGAVASTLSSLTDNDTLDTLTNINANLPADTAADAAFNEGDLNLAQTGFAGQAIFPGGAALSDEFAVSGLSANFRGGLADDPGLGVDAEAGMGADSEALLARLAGADEGLFGEAGSFLRSGFMSLLRDGGPVAVSKRWGSMSDEEQAELIASERENIGSLDGIPSEIRDAINSEDLDGLITDTEAQIAELREAATQADPDHDDDQAKRLLCLQQAGVLALQLDGLLSLRRLKQENADMYLLSVGTDRDGAGQFILAVGLPDTAEHVATLVPSAGTGLSGAINVLVPAAASLAQAARDAGGGAQTSVVVWAGYSTPLDGSAQETPPEVQAAAALSQFQDGLAATSTQDGADRHTTVIGDFAGSAVIGAAARQPDGLAADDVIILGDHALDAAAVASLKAGRAAGDGEGTQVWAAVSEAAGFSAVSPLMPDLAHITVASYDNIYFLARQ